MPPVGCCTGLRTVEFLPRRCPEGSHTVPDEATGATCVCKAGFEPDTTSTTTLSCHRNCGPGEISDGSLCMCSGRNYDTDLHGILICNAGGWEPAENGRTYQDAIEIRAQGFKCVPCPTECAVCDNGTATLLPGWRLNASTDTAMKVQLAAGKDGRPQHVFSCPYSQTDCPSLELSDTLNATSADIACAGNHVGPLCATCKDGFSRRGADDNTCEECEDIPGYIQQKFGVPVKWFFAILVAVGLVAGAVACLGKLMLAKFLWIKAETKVNQRILLGEVQMLALLP